MKKKCTNAVVGNQLWLDIGWTFSGAGVVLTPAYVRHIWECDFCRDSLPLLFRKAEATQKMIAAFGIANRAEGGDPRILRKQGKRGTLLFEPHQEDNSRGMLVVITPEDLIHDSEEITLDEFNRME